jgi:hypothetical protein
MWPTSRPISPDDAYPTDLAVASVIYNAGKNPDRIGVDFLSTGTVNAERIELFATRESRLVTTDSGPADNFVCK